MAYGKCKICGRKLTNPKAQELGFGIKCYKKFIARQVKIRKLFKERKYDKCGN